MEAEGRHPVCVVTRGEAIPRLDNVVVATVSSRLRGLGSEVRLGLKDGMPRECAISLDNLRTVPKAQLVEAITELGAEKMDEVCRALALASGCWGSRGRRSAPGPLRPGPA
jgi:mRNA interferase MazF